MALGPYQNILVPLDGSDTALRALDYAANLARVAEMQILLLHVAPPGPLEMMRVMGYPAAARHDAEGLAAEYEQARKSMADHVFESARGRLPADLPVRQMMLSGDPAGVIIEQAEKLGNAVVVMGNRGMSNVRELVIGGVSSKVLHHAHCPVTIVR